MSRKKHEFNSNIFYHTVYFYPYVMYIKTIIYITIIFHQYVFLLVFYFKNYIYYISHFPDNINIIKQKVFFIIQRLIWEKQLIRNVDNLPLLLKAINHTNCFTGKQSNKIQHIQLVRFFFQYWNIIIISRSPVVVPGYCWTLQLIYPN